MQQPVASVVDHSSPCAYGYLKRCQLATCNGIVASSGEHIRSIVLNHVEQIKKSNFICATRVEASDVFIYIHDNSSKDHYLSSYHIYSIALFY